MNEEREWTVMFYLASDNPLAPGTIQHLKAIKNAGYHPEVNVLAQFDPHTVNLPVHVFDVNSIEKMKNPNKANIGFAGNDPFVRNLVTDKLWPDDVQKLLKEALKKRNIDMPFRLPVPPEKLSEELAPKDSLEVFLEFCQKNYPARHYMLFMVGHGVIVGNELFLRDEHVATTRQGNSRPVSLSLVDLANILDKFNDRLSKHQQLEMIGFHACSMSGAEVAFQLQGKANYMLAAQGPTYNGAWPYRQILIRLFNDLNSSKNFTKGELPDGIVDLVKRGTNPFSKFIRSRLNGNGTRELLEEHVLGKQPAPKLVGALTDELNALLDDPKLSKEFMRKKLTAMRNDPPSTIKVDELDGKDLRRINRQLILRAVPRINVKRLCKKIFAYCLFNSFDFQLAGYSCDLTLCDLNKVGELQEPVSNLVKALLKGLRFSRRTNNSIVRELMILAHWEAQSFFQEQYTDLYDYCFRLRTNCEAERIKNPSRPTQRLLQEIENACKDVMTVLKRGKHNDDNGIIVRSEFAGPAYQYAHGLSVFFPWSEPVANPMWKKLYRRFAFKETKWQQFLKLYFAETMRKPAGDEVNDVEPPFIAKNLDSDLLELVQALATQVFNDDGQLGPAGSRDPLGVAGSRDPQGDDCDCVSIKNYPSITHSDKRSLTPHNQQAINILRQLRKDFTTR
ncbi:MAG TPA: clostripain-related cysteine peptidase [Pyrinomonadaceae bacterium]|nr:clostripain-related cysteine peptidase [Pyrinomonadaceae bacterium]